MRETVSEFGQRWNDRLTLPNVVSTVRDGENLWWKKNSSDKKILIKIATRRGRYKIHYITISR